MKLRFRKMIQFICSIFKHEKLQHNFRFPVTFCFMVWVMLFHLSLISLHLATIIGIDIQRKKIVCFQLAYHLQRVIEVLLVSYCSMTIIICMQYFFAITWTFLNTLLIWNSMRILFCYCMSLTIIYLSKIATRFCLHIFNRTIKWYCTESSWHDNHVR